MSKIKRIGVDLAKNVFQVHAVDEHGTTLFNKQIKRAALLKWFATVERDESCVVAMEACGGSQYWGRALQALNYTVRILHPKFVKAYVQGNKNDRNDASAICEAGASPRLQNVPVRSVEQLDVLVMHRRRERLTKQRTMVINQTRGLLAEYGLVIAKNVTAFYRELPGMIGDADNALTLSARAQFGAQWEELMAIDKRLAALDKTMEQYAKSNANCRRLMTIEGVGPVTATAIVAKVGDAQHFQRARQFSNSLGIVPGEHSSGGKTQLGAIHKRGDRYSRTLLIHGARSALNAANEHSAPRLQKLKAKAVSKDSKNKAIVALANHNARICYALLRDRVDYQIKA